MEASRRRGADRALRRRMRSPGRPPVGRREHRQRFWEEVARGLSSEEAAVAAGVSPAVGARWFRECGGMPPLNLRPQSRRYLAFIEREEIAVLRARGRGVREIARQLGRSPSTISRELRRNAATGGRNLEYRATTAQWHADRRAKRPKLAKLATNGELRQYVQGRLGGLIAAPDGKPCRAPMCAGSDGVAVADKTGGGRSRGVPSKSPTGYGSTSPAMSPCVYRTKPSTRRSTFRAVVRCDGS